MAKGYNVDSNIPPFGVKLNVSNNINSGTKSTVSVMKSRIPRKCQLTTNSKLNKASRNKIDHKTSQFSRCRYLHYRCINLNEIQWTKICLEPE